jgi:hypothetical protein
MVQLRTVAKEIDYTANNPSNEGAGEFSQFGGPQSTIFWEMFGWALTSRDFPKRSFGVERSQAGALGTREGGGREGQRVMRFGGAGVVRWEGES